MDFDIDKPPKQESPAKKAFNKKEAKELNEEKLWKEPDFSQWFDKRYGLNSRPRGIARDL